MTTVSSSTIYTVNFGVTVDSFANCQSADFVFITISQSKGLVIHHILLQIILWHLWNLISRTIKKLHNVPVVNTNRPDGEQQWLQSAILVDWG